MALSFTYKKATLLDIVNELEKMGRVDWLDGKDDWTFFKIKMAWYKEFAPTEIPVAKPKGPSTAEIFAAARARAKAPKK